MPCVSPNLPAASAMQRRISNTAALMNLLGCDPTAARVVIPSGLVDTEGPM